MIYILRLLPIDSDTQVILPMMAPNKTVVAKYLCEEYQKAKRSGVPKLRLEGSTISIPKSSYHYYDTVFSEDHILNYVYPLLDYIELYGVKLGNTDCDVVCVAGMDLEVT